MEALDGELIEQAYEPQAVTIKPLHFVLLCLATFGFYLFWWHYKVWRFIKQKDHKDIYPALRALFGIIFSVALFARVADLAAEKGREVSYNTPFTYVVYLLLLFTNFLSLPLGLLSVFTFVPQVFVLRELNYYFSGIFNGPDTQRLNARQIVLLILGVTLWLLMFRGSFEWHWHFGGN